MITQRNSNGVFMCRKYGLMTTEGSMGNTATAGTLESGDNHKETTGIGDTNGTDTGTGEQNRQQAPPTHSQPEEK